MLSRFSAWPALFLFIASILPPAPAFATPSTDSLAGYWKFDETTGGSSIIDASGDGHHGTPSGTNGIHNKPQPSTDVAAGFNFTNARSLSFDGNDDIVTVPHDADLNIGSSDFTVSAWVQGGSMADGDVIFGKSNGGGAGTSYGFLFGVWNSLKPTVYFSTSVTNLASVQSDTAIANDQWYHIAIVVDRDNAGNSKVYIDGSPVASTASNLSDNTGNISNSVDLLVGSESDGGFYWHGDLDDARLYTRALSAAEIAELAAGEHPTAIWDGTSGTDWETAANWNTNAVPDPYTIAIVRRAGSGSPVMSAVESGASLIIEGSGSLNLHGFDFEFTDSGELKGGGTLKLLGAETTNPSNVGTASTGTVLYYGTGSYSGLAAGNAYYNLTINDGLAGYWTLDETTGTTAEDASGNGNYGVHIGDPTIASTTAPTQFSNARSLTFDGSNDYVSLGHVQDGATVFTWSAWIKTTVSSSHGNYYQMPVIIGTPQGGGDTNDAILGINNGELAWFDELDAGNTFDSNTAVNDGAWHHVAVVRNGTSLQFYVDGSSAGTDTTGTNGLNGNGLEIAKANWSDNTFFPGSIDDVRVYNRVLQPYEIAALASGNQPATASGTFTLDAAIGVANDLVIAAGELDASGSDHTIFLSGSWLNYGGQFSPQEGVVVFEGAGGSEVLQSGGQAFHDVSFLGTSTWTLQDLLDVGDQLSLSTGGIDVSTSNFSIHTRQFAQAGGTFTPRSGLVVLNSPVDYQSTFLDTLSELQIEDPTENGLVGYWKFDEGQGNQAVDISGSANHGTRTGTGAIWSGALLPDLQFDNIHTMRFNGSDDYVRVATFTNVPSSTLTVCTWLRTTASTAMNLVVQGRSPDDSDTEFIFRVNNGMLNFWDYDGGYGFHEDWDNETAVHDGAWHHACFVKSGTSGTYYVDGVADGTRIADQDAAYSTNDFVIGYDYRDSTAAFNGYLDDVRIYNRSLTAGEIANLANGYYADGVIGTATVTLGGNLDLATMTILSGKISGGARTIDVSGDWNNYAGTGSFVAGTSTVDLDGGSTQNVRGSTNFYNFEISTASAQTVNFGSGTTQAVSNQLTLTGQSSNILTLAPLVAATTWFLDVDVAAGQSIQYVSPRSSDASAGAEIAANDGTSIDGGENLHWNFTAAAASTGGRHAGAFRQREALAQSGGGAGRVAANTGSATTAFVPDYTPLATQLAEAQRRAREEAAELYPESRQIGAIRDMLLARFQDALTGTAPSHAGADEEPQPSETEPEPMARPPSRRTTQPAIAERRGRLLAIVREEQVLYADVPTNAWFAPYVATLIADEIATGYADESGKLTGEFGVGNPVTLAEALKMALEAAGQTLRLGSPRNPSAQGSWAAAYVAHAEDAQMTIFTPDRNVHAPATRGEVIRTMLEAFDIPADAKRREQLFADLDPDHPHAPALAVAYLYGIIDGDTDPEGNPTGTVRPDDPMNRAEVAKLIAIMQELQR